MKKLFISLLTLTAIFTSCEEDTVTYGDNFVAFTDPRSVDFNVAEREGPITFTVGIAKVQATDITINVSTNDENAVAGTDYNFPSTITIPAGEMYTDLSIDIVDNTEINPSKTFTLELTGVSNGDIPVGFADEGSHSKTITISNDDYDCPTEFEYWIGGLEIVTDGTTTTGSGSANAADDCDILVVTNDLPQWISSGYAGEFNTEYSIQFIPTSADGTEGYVTVPDTMIEDDFATFSDGSFADAHYTASGEFNTNTGIITLSYSVDLYSGSEYVQSFYTGETTIEYAN